MKTVKREEKPIVLAVDDESDVIDTIKGLLRREFRVLGTTRASEGLQLLDLYDVHVVLADQRMPEMTGVDFLTEVQRRRPNAVRILCTAYADISSVIRAVNEGHIYRYLTKPWDPQEFVAVMRQAADKWRLQNERERLLADLQAKTKELEEANQQLAEADFLKDVFVRVAGHELRTPLTVILGLSELASTMDGVPEPLGEWIKQIHSESLRLDRRIEEIFKLLSVKDYAATLQISEFPLAQLAWDATDEVNPFVQRRQQRLETLLSDAVGSMKADREKLQDALTQVLMNAIKYTPDGGRIYFRVRRDEEHQQAIFVIRDTGVGIHADDIEHIFDPFFTRSDVRHHASGECDFNRSGLGLGLSVTRAFVEMHGGNIRVASRPGVGTQFTIRIPLDCDLSDSKFDWCI